MRQGRKLVAVAVCMLAFAACGGGEKVGSAFEDFEGEGAGDRIGDVAATPTPKPKANTDGGQAAARTAAPQRTAAPAQPKAQAPKATPKPAAQQPSSSITVKITAGGFDPTAARVSKGSVVTVTNTDSAAHTYTSSDGTYDTGQLAPGQSKNLVAGTGGSFQMEDRTRNWIIGTLEVVG